MASFVLLKQNTTYDNQKQSYFAWGTQEFEPLENENDKDVN